MRINKSLITQTTGGTGSGSVTSVGLSVTTPTGLTQVVTGSPITSSGTLSLALSFTAGYAIPTTLKQTNWDDAYTWVSAFPTTTGNPDEVLYTDGSTLSWSKVFTSTISATGSPNSSTFLRGDGVWSTPTGFANPMTTLGDTIYGAASGVATRLAGNTTTIRRFLMSQGSGIIAAAPIWDAVTKSDVGLSSVENTAISTWAGSSNITTVGTIATGTWNATTISVSKGGTGLTALGAANQLLRVNAAGTNLEYFTPSYISAAITSLGGLTASTQTFANDTNVIITSTASTHTLGWSGTLSIARGGTNATTALAAFDNLAPTTTLGDIIYHNGTDNVRLAGNVTPAKQFLSQTGTSGTSAAPVWSVVTKTDVGLANVENTALSTWTGSANITTLGTIATGTWNATTIAVNRGGTGATTLTGIVIGAGTTAFTAVAGTASQLLRRNAGNTAYEFFTPTYLTAAITSLGGLTTATQTFANDTNVTITSATSTHTLGWTGQLSIARGGTNATTAVAAFDNLAPTTTLGDIIYHNGTDNVRLAGNITPAKQFLSQTGTSSVSAAPSWTTIAKADVGLGNVENTALSTWAGSSNITTVGTIATGTWGGTSISIIKGGTGLTAIGSANQLLRVNALGTALEYFTPSYLTTNQTITLSGNVTGSGTTAITTTIANNVVTNAMLSQVATATFKGRFTAGTGNVETITGSDATQLLDEFSGTGKGLVPSNPLGTFPNTYFLRADGSWAIPPPPFISNIYNSDGSLNGDRGVNTQTYTLNIFGSPNTATKNVLIVGNSNTSGYTTACIGLDTSISGGAVDIRFASTNPYSLRMYASDSELTTSPVGAGLQLFSNSHPTLKGHVYIDSGANNSAKIVFRTAATSGTISSRMEIGATGQLKLNTYTAITSWTTGVLVGYLGFDSSGNIMTASGTGGGSTNVSIGQSVTGGVSSNILYVSSSQTLAQTSNFLINGSNNLQANDGANIEFGTTIGTILGITSSQKLAFWGATPIVRPSTGGATSTFTPNTGTAINASSTFDGYTLGQIVKALRNIGLLN